MDEVYHQLVGATEVADADLTLPRARHIADAVTRHRDYTMVQALRLPVTSDIAHECIVVDVECHGVPPKNPHGIRFRERLALCIPANPEQLVEVLALRKGFPVLMHQNQGRHGLPASLCLYFEPPISVARTWTPQRFLRRVQWWLEKSATGELHPADQPVEGLFFASRYELVLPWNLDELRKDDTRSFVIARGPDRPNGMTCFLEPVDKDQTGDKTFTHIELTLPPVVHGFVERDPTTLGDLADTLGRRGLDLLAPLQEALQARISDQGAPASEKDSNAIVLMHVPICRAEGGEPVAMARRAFLIAVGVNKLGTDLGALVLHDNRYYRDYLNNEPGIAWRAHELMPMDVLYRNDAAAARRQSGIGDEGPTGVLIGAGSLGSALLAIWGRSGWGSWTVIDKDHIKPHNLSRHTAYSQHIGEPKSTAVAGLHDAVMYGASRIAPIVADACDTSQEPIREALAAANLAVDASTTLEYPRAASGNGALARHVSAFLTPDGNGSVLLAEDAARSVRLRALEAQYYCAVIEEAWGESHLSYNPATFWSGASCWDLSMVMPYEKVLGHAATLAEQIRRIAGQDQAIIRVWQRDPANGAVEMHEIQAQREQNLRVGDSDLFISSGTERKLRQWRSDAFPNETGGVLLGYYDFNIGAVIVVTALPAPVDSKSDPSSFKRGIAGLTRAVEQASKRTSGVVSYIGEWHSHPPGHSASPSSDDLIQLIHLALGMDDDGLPAVQLIVGDDDIQVLQGKVA